MDTYLTYVLLVALTPPAGSLRTITDEFLGIRALSSVYSENNTNTEKNMSRFVRTYSHIRYIHIYTYSHIHSTSENPFTDRKAKFYR